MTEYQKDQIITGLKVKLEKYQAELAHAADKAVELNESLQAKDNQISLCCMDLGKQGKEIAQLKFDRLTHESLLKGRNEDLRTSMKEKNEEIAQLKAHMLDVNQRNNKYRERWTALKYKLEWRTEKVSPQDIVKEMEVLEHE